MGSHPKHQNRGDYFGTHLIIGVAAAAGNGVCHIAYQELSLFLPLPIEEIKLDQQLLDMRVCFGITATAAAASTLHIAREQSVCFQRAARTSASLCVYYLFHASNGCIVDSL
jgi:hypothetical protein